MKPLITLNNVGVRYKRSGNIFRRRNYFDALKKVDLNIYPGETLGILGRNGAGKSTLLRIISGVIKPNSGHIHNHGATVSLLALQAGFDINLTGRDNAILGGMLQGYSRSEVEDRLKDIHEYSELEDFFFQPVRTYSTGMSARLGFSISTILSPDILLVDEVLSVGDQHFRKKAEKTMVGKLQSEQTVVLVSHSHNQIKRLCDRAILLESGTTIYQGGTQKTLALYENKLENSV